MDFLPELAPARGLILFDLTTKKISTLPSSEGLRSPRWSLDGRYIAALRDDGKLVLYEYSTHKRTDLGAFAGRYGFFNRNWSRDGKLLYLLGVPTGERLALSCYRLSERKWEEIISPEEFKKVPGVTSFGLAPDDSPLFVRDTSVTEIYALDFEAP